MTTTEPAYCSPEFVRAQRELEAALEALAAEPSHENALRVVYAWRILKAARAAL